MPINLTGRKFGRLIAIEKDLSKVYKRAHWKCICDCGNIVTVRGCNLINNNTKSCGCLSKLSKEQIETTINEQNNHKLLSDYSDYKNDTSKLKILCPNGNEINISYNQFKYHHLICDSSRHISEEVIRSCFEYYFPGYKFPNLRIGSMRSPKNYPLEFDGFNDELKLGFECNGLQHREITYYSKTPDKLNYIKKHDDIKQQYAKDNSITLLKIDIENNQQYDDIPQLVKDVLTKNGYDIKNRIPTLDALKPFRKTKLLELQELAKIRGGELLSKTYLGWRYKLEWTCKEKHEFEMNPNNAKRYWCPTCAGNKRHDIGYVKKYIIGHPEFDEYKNAQAQLIVRCPHKVKFGRSFLNIQNRGILIPSKCNSCSLLKNR